MKVTPINPVKTLRPLNAKEVGIALKLSSCLHYIIRQLDELEGTSIYRHSLRQKAKLFLVEAEKHQSDNVWDLKKVQDSPDINKASDQMDSMSDLVGNLFTLCLASGDIPKDQLQSFWGHMADSFEKFNIPLNLTEDGVLEFKVMKIGEETI